MWLLGLLLSLATCGELRTRSTLSSRIDPSVADQVRERDPGLSWPREPLPTSVAYSDDGVGIRYLRDFIHIRPRTQVGLDQLFEEMPYLSLERTLEFEDASGSQSFPPPDIILQRDGAIDRPQIDLVLRVDWTAFPTERVAGVPLPELGLTYDSSEAVALVQLLGWLNQSHRTKIASAHPITLVIDGVLDSTPRSVSLDPSSPNFCPCVDIDTDPFTYDSSRVALVPTEVGEVIVDCASQAFVSGNNLLTLQEAEVRASWEPWNSEQNIRMWVIPEQDFPLKLPGSPPLGTLAEIIDWSLPFIDLDGPYLSLFEDPQLEKWIPPHAHSSSLRGPLRRGPEDFCEWPANDQSDRLAYRNSGQWMWETQEADEAVGVFLYESDEGFCWWIFCAGLSDDPIALLPIRRGDTLEAPRAYEGPGLSLSFQTITQCGGGGLEVCDGLDNDCNGAIDETDPDLGTECAPDRPICEPGAWACAPQGTLECTGFVEPTVDLCDGLDNDCDGEVDDDDFQVGLPCGSNIGSCTTSEILCSSGSLDCAGGQGPSPESCGDGIDDDCDATIDEGCPCLVGDSRPCGINVGVCTLGTQVCPAGNWSVCDGVSPTTEICDDMDNDCNGVTDEGLLNACGQCGPVPVEICNMMDDDCDGLVDESGDGVQFGLQNACGTCGPPPAEVCNDLDDDCDGAIDENVPDCGLLIEEGHFEVNGNSTDWVLVPKPAASSVIPLVFVDQYLPNTDDDFEFDIICSDEGVAYLCSVSTAIGNGGSQVEGRIVALGAGTNADAQTLAGWQVGSGMCIDAVVPPPGSNVLVDLRRYHTATDDDFSFAVDASGTVQACGYGGNGGSEAAGDVASLEFPVSVDVLVVDETVWNGVPELITWPGVSDAYPLIAVTSYEAATDDDVSWSISCLQAGADYTCALSVEDGSAGSHVRFQGFLVDR